MRLSACDLRIRSPNGTFFCIKMNDKHPKRVPKATNMEPKRCPNDTKGTLDRKRNGNGALHLRLWGTILVQIHNKPHRRFMKHQSDKYGNGFQKVPEHYFEKEKSEEGYY